MKSTATFLKCIVFIGFVSIFLSSSGGRSDNRAGAPGDAGSTGSCRTCHTGNNNDDKPGSITLSGVPTAYVPGQTYSLTLTLTQAVQPIGGFQIVATNGINNTQIGTFTDIPGETRVTTSMRLTHSTPKNLTGGSVSWTTDWTAPSSGTAPTDVVFYYAGNAANGDGLRNNLDYGYVGNSATVLPVELLSFEAERTEGNSTLISWQTTNEVNHDFFTIERSTDKRNFEIVGKIYEASHVIDEIKNYIFVDENLPQSEDVYYRLKQVDYDGDFAYSEVRHVGLNSKDLSVFPNPLAAGNDISVKFNSENAGDRNISLFNVEGKLVFRKKNSTERGQNVLHISDVLLEKGIYFLSLEGAAQIQRIVVQ